MKAQKSIHPLHRGLQRVHKTLKNHFVPHEGNNHVPHVMHHRALFGYSMVVVLLKAMLVAASLGLPAASLFSSAITTTNIVSLTNASRESLSLPLLSTNEVLQAAAQAKANDMVEHQYFAHTSPDGVTPWYWFGLMGYKYRYAGENLAVFFTSAEDVHNGWMASSTHRANIVSEKYSEIGIGIAQGEYEGFPATFVVQMFGYPSTPPPVVAVEPVPEPTPEPTAPTQVLGEETTEEPAPSAIEEHSVVIAPSPTEENTYTVSLNAPEATTVTAHLGPEEVKLVETAPDTFEGSVTYHPQALDQNGAELFAIVNAADGVTKESLAVVSPNAQTQDAYAFGAEEQQTTKIFGLIPFSQFQDNVQLFYIYTLIFLGVMLAVTILVRIEIQRPTIVAHAVIVMLLTLVLTFV